MLGTLSSPAAATGVPGDDKSGEASVADRGTIVGDCVNTATLEVHIDVRKYKTRTRKRTP